MDNDSIESRMRCVSTSFEKNVLSHTVMTSRCEASLPYHRPSLVDLSKIIRLGGITDSNWNGADKLTSQGFLIAFGPAAAERTKGRRFCLSALHLHLPDGFAETLVLPSFQRQSRAPYASEQVLALVFILAVKFDV